MNNRLKYCTRCGHLVAKVAPRCPSCGKPPRRTGWPIWAKVIVSIVGCWLGAAVILAAIDNRHTTIPPVHSGGGEEPQTVIIGNKVYRMPVDKDLPNPTPGDGLPPHSADMDPYYAMAKAQADENILEICQELSNKRNEYLKLNQEMNHPVDSYSLPSICDGLPLY